MREERRMRMRMRRRTGTGTERGRKAGLEAWIKWVGEKIKPT